MKTLFLGVVKKFRMKRLFVAVVMMIGSISFSQSQESIESYILNINFNNFKSLTNSNSSPKKVFLKEKITYDDHVFEASSFNVPLITDYIHMDQLISEHKLVNVPEEGEGYTIQKLTHSKAVLMQPAFDVLLEISNLFYQETNKKLSISSLTRTLETQSKLRRVNSNAAKGDSAHEYGAAFDISYSQYDDKKGRNYTLENLLQGMLDEMVTEGKIYYIKEKRQPCFHITIRNPNLVYPESLSEEHIHNF